MPSCDDPTGRLAALGDAVRRAPRSPVDGLPAAHLPDAVEAELAVIEDARTAAGRPARAPLPVVGAGECSAACAGPCQPARDEHVGVELFTLDEARRALVDQECDSDGCDLDVVWSETFASTRRRPVALVCSRGCSGPSYRVAAAADVDPTSVLSAALVDLWGDLGAAYDRSPAEPRETSIECHALITRIVDIARVVGVTPAELVDPALIVDGIYERVHAQAGRDAAVRPCTLADARERLAARDAARAPRDVTPAGGSTSSAGGSTSSAGGSVVLPAGSIIPCPYWMRGRGHGCHDWTPHATLGPYTCTGYPTPEAPCPAWSREAVHGPHLWTPPGEGPSYCPGVE